MELALALALLVVVVIGSVVLARVVRHPENTASHSDDGRRSPGERFYSDTDRPAGPDAEDPGVPPNRFPDQAER